MHAQRLRSDKRWVLLFSRGHLRSWEQQRLTVVDVLKKKKSKKNIWPVLLLSSSFWEHCPLSLGIPSHVVWAGSPRPDQSEYSTTLVQRGTRDSLKFAVCFMGERAEAFSFGIVSSRNNISRSFLKQLSLFTQKSVSAIGENKRTHRMRDGERVRGREGGKQQALPTLSPWISVCLKPGRATKTKG